MISPIFIVVAFLLMVSNCGKVFFTQQRPGMNGKIFRVIKFKTMNDKCDTSGELLPDFERMTRIGRFIRSTSLDEIPQLLNVLKGDMSLVGPRPLLVQYIPLYSPQQARRHEVRPGITGWAQINGRNAIDWERKFQYDVWYVDNINFRVDCHILWKTIKKVFKREDINSGQNITMEPFKGN
ncbi:MAG: sugar transferase [Alistipes sp.]|nr:sugar transferase [Alistipes sp.]